MKGKQGYRRLKQYCIATRPTIYRAFYPTTAEHILFYSACGAFSRVDHILGYKNVSVNVKGLE